MRVDWIIWLRKGSRLGFMSMVMSLQVPYEIGISWDPE
jgi:hypothetical protein